MWRVMRFILAAPAKHIGASLLLAAGLIAYSGSYTFILTSELRQISSAAKADAAPAATEEDEREAALSAAAPMGQKPAPVESAPVYPGLSSFAKQLEKIPGSSPALTRVASLTPLATIAPTKQPAAPAVAKSAPRWNPPLDKREAIAHAYLKRECPEVIKFDGQESVADKMRVQAHFMRATTPGQIIAIVRSEIRRSGFLRSLGYCPSIMADK